MHARCMYLLCKYTEKFPWGWENGARVWFGVPISTRSLQASYDFAKSFLFLYPIVHIFRAYLPKLHESSNLSSFLLNCSLNPEAWIFVCNKTSLHKAMWIFIRIDDRFSGAEFPSDFLHFKNWPAEYGERRRTASLLSTFLWVSFEKFFHIFVKNRLNVSFFPLHKLKKRQKSSHSISVLKVSFIFL